MTAAGRAQADRPARWLPLLVTVVGLILSAVLAAALAAHERRHRAQVAAAEIGALERTLRVGLDQRGRVLARTARRWQLAGGRTRADFDLEAAVNIESYPSIRAVGWVGPDMVVRWVYPAAGNERVVGLDNRREPRRRTALVAARRSGALRVAGPLTLTQGGRALLFFQHIGSAAGRDWGYVYAAFDPSTMAQQIIGDAAPASALRVSVNGDPIYVRPAAGGVAMPADAPSASARFAFGEAAWRIEAWAPPARLGLAEVAPIVAALLALALGVGTRAALRAQARGSSLRGELQAGEARFRTVTDTMPGLLFVTDPAGANVHTNVVFQTYTGLPAEALLGDGWLSTLHPDDRARAAEVWQRAVATASSYEAEYRFRRADGAYRWFLVRGLPHRDREGRIDRWFGTCTDVHDLREADARLRESERRFRTLADAMPALVYTARDRGNTYVNERYARYTGISAEELMGEGWRRVVHPDDAARLGGGRTRGAGDSLDTELRLRRADGEWRWHLVRGLRDPGDPGLWIGAMVDIHDRRAAEARLAESEARFRELADNMSQFAWTADASGWIYWYNKRWLDYTGSTPEAMAGWGWREVHHPDHVDRVVERIRACFAAGEPWEDTFPLRGRDGGYRWFLSRAVPIRDEGGHVLRWFGTNTDVTERIEAEEEVRRLNRNLEALVEARTRRLNEVNAELQAFAYSVSHDLRAPLRAMQGFSHALVEDYAERLDELGRDYVGRIAAGAKQMDALIQDLLAYSRLSREEIAPAPVRLEEAVDAALRQVAAVLRDRGAEVEVVRPLPVVRGHAPILTQVIANLVANAAKFVAAGVTPRIRLCTEARGRYIRLWVEDNGIGIAPEHRARIFEVFQRLHGMAEYPGTGIGLAIVKKGIERLGGTVGVESTPGEGSRFWIELPQER
jgi:PAS domain S-box-containing protein